MHIKALLYVSFFKKEDKYGRRSETWVIRWDESTRQDFSLCCWAVQWAVTQTALFWATRGGTETRRTREWLLVLPLLWLNAAALLWWNMVDWMSVLEWCGAVVRWNVSTAYDSVWLESSPAENHSSPSFSCASSSSLADPSVSETLTDLRCHYTSSERPPLPHRRHSTGPNQTRLAQGWFRTLRVKEFKLGTGTDKVCDCTLSTKWPLNWGLCNGRAKVMSLLTVIKCVPAVRSSAVVYAVRLAWCGVKNCSFNDCENTCLLWFGVVKGG